MAYEWTITADFLAETGERSDVGVVGPYNAKRDHEAIKNDPEGKKFRMFDDDGNLYYEGVLVGDSSGFEPLDDFGRGNAGCTEIKYLNAAGEWVLL